MRFDELDLPISEGRDVYVIGDIHGCIDGMRRAVESTGLANPLTWRWTAGDALLVFMGDFLHRNKYEADVIEALLALKESANGVGGEVTWVLGNHDIGMASDRGEEAHEGASQRWRIFMDRYDKFQTLSSEQVRALALRSVVPQKLATMQPLVFRFQRKLFVHGGVELAHLSHLVKWNKQVRSHLLVGAPLPDWKKDLGSADDPTWSRAWGRNLPGSMNLAEKEMELRYILNKLDCDCMIVGHTAQMSINSFKGLVWRTDTGMWSGRGLVEVLWFHKGRTTIISSPPVNNPGVYFSVFIPGGDRTGDSLG